MDLLKGVNLSNKWEKLSGEGNWKVEENGEEKDLLNPLDADLRGYIIHYGLMAGACGDLFESEMRADDEDLYLFDNGEKKIQVTKADFFQKACLEKGNLHKYKVTKFFEAGSANVRPAWFGYVAVSDGKDAMGRIDILIAWRGPATDSEWGIIKQTQHRYFTGPVDATKVHDGLRLLYFGVTQGGENEIPIARHQVREEVIKLVEEYKDEDISITVTGFSLGGALATMNAVDIVMNGYNKPKGNPNKSCMVTAFVFGSPPVGNDGFKQAVDNNSELHILRIANSADLVLGYLSEKLDEQVPQGYMHVGELLEVDSSKSPCLKQRASETSLASSLTFDEFINVIAQPERTSEGSFQLNERVSSHNIDVYLHAVSGAQNNGFSLAVNHDVALVNKHLDLLRDGHRIPANWWERHRKIMFQLENGHWKVNSFGFNWEKLSGKENWKDQLSPLNLDLRRYIIHYGQMAGACGDLFNTGTEDCKATKENVFSEACLVKGNNHQYEVTKFIYGGIGTVDPIWIGYVAVSKGDAMGRKDILIAWRGTATLKEWLNNAKVDVVSKTSNSNDQNVASIFNDENVKVHSGFLSLYTGKCQQPPDRIYVASARDEVKGEVERLLEEHKEKTISITVTGFSLGSALATINALDIVKNEYNKLKSDPSKSYMVTAFVFGGPHVGNYGFKFAVDNTSKLHILRIINENDPVPKLLGWGPFKASYKHVANELIVDSWKSNYLKPTASGRSDDSLDGIEDFLNLNEDEINQVVDYDEYTESERTSRGLSSLPDTLTSRLPLVRKLKTAIRSHNMDLYLHAVAGYQGNNYFSLDVDLDTALVNKYTDLLKGEYNIPANWWAGPNRQKMCQQKDNYDRWRWMVKAREEDPCPSPD